MVKSIVILLVLFLSGATFAQDVFKGQLLEQAGQFEQAWQVYKTALEKNPQDQQALLGVIRVCRQLKMFDSLLVILQGLEKKTPENPDLILGKVEALLELKRKRAGREQAREFSQKWSGRLMDLVETFLRVGEKDLAAQYLEEVLTRRGFRVNYAEKLVEIYEGQGKFILAAEKLVEVVNHEPHRFNKFLDRLSTYGKGTAVKGVLRALNKLEDSQNRLRAQAEVMLGAGNQMGAAQIVQRVLNLNEKEQCARRWEKRGSLDGALAIYQESGLYADAARVLRKLGRFDEALALLARDTSAAARFEYGEFLRLEKGDFASAAKAYSDALRKRPQDNAALYGLAAAMVGLRNLDSARKVLAKISSPDDEALFLQAKIFFYQGKFDSAGGLVREINARFPQSLLVNDALELALLALNGERALELATAMLDFETGARGKSLERTRGLTRENDAVAQHAFVFLAKIFFREGRYREALAVLDTFLMRFPQDELVPRVIFEQAEIYRQGLKDERRFRETVERLMIEFPGSPYTPLARNLLEKTTGALEPGQVR